MKTIDLNCDMGESFGAYTLGYDDLAMPFVTSINVACGFHASDPDHMRKRSSWRRKTAWLSARIRGFPILSASGGVRWR